ncbi:armadillo repeat-containing protein 6 homolog [Teleopsis dalmanni]|uniref:armadillo repeat-containing protein 6 homolog n=1 Tax=Teleopsis dalmanni TaxID=139649 RepID=UPI0018CDBD37|nr:armadillo repeat-containing protein 6 homolog [Teleopsis dalmanni]XP_037956959.1 armadillo repeat-containing protein 6 homolog [Teleopsis dalmanni]
MSKVISQETFDDVVKENIVDFSMDPVEAKEETIKQFEAQGINLANIIKDLALNPDSGVPLLNETIDKIKAHIGANSSETETLLECLVILEEECQKSIPHRVLAGKNGAHDVLITLLEGQVLSENNSNPNIEVLEKCLKAMNSLINKQPDLFDAESLALIIPLLKVENVEICCLTLQWLQKACIMHEMNRQNIMNAGLLKHLKSHVSKNNVQVLSNVIAVFRYLVLDDDIRIEYGCAHEHAKNIANEVLVDLTKLLKDIQDTNVVADLLLTIGTLSVRHEFCAAVEEVGGLKIIFEIMTANPKSVRINREALKLIRALAGHDSVKLQIVQQGAAPIIKELLVIHNSNENVVSVALLCISTLTLRAKDNSVTFFEIGVTEPIVEVIRLHPKNKMIQRNAAWAIRNMVSRSRDQCETWLSHGIEDLLNAAMIEHPAVEHDIKAALRDLGCKVVLKEEWTGTAEKKIVNS